MTANQSEIKKQIEYYLSDKNLATDNFFYDKIKADKEVRSTPLNHSPLTSSDYRAG